MLALIDNYDSFTYNLVQYLGELGASSQVYRNDEVTVPELRAKLSAAKTQAIIISPGPCTPNEAGISMQVTRELAADFPILGVCLGMQAMVQAYGGKIITADKIMHGKVSSVFHNSSPLFEGIENPFQAARYHSLSAQQESLPQCFEITAWTSHDNGGKGADIAESYNQIEEIMGVRHKELPLMGVQFHPESILTKQGKNMLKNFLTMIAN